MERCEKQTETNTEFSREIEVYRLLCIFTAVVTLVSANWAIYLLLKRNIFHNSTKVLLFLNVMFAVAHESFSGVSEAVDMYRILTFTDNNCMKFVDGKDCSLVTKYLFMTITGMVLTLLVLTFERILAMVRPQMFLSASYTPGAYFAAVVVVMSFVIPQLTFGDDSFSGKTPSCKVMKPTAQRYDIALLLACAVVNFIELLLIAYTLIYFKITQSKKFDVVIRYHQQESMISSMALLPMSIFQFVCLCYYSIGNLLLLEFKSSMSNHTWGVFVVYLYIIPLSSASLPIFIIITTYQAGYYRRKAISRLRRTPGEADEHFRRLEKAWA